MAAYVRACTKVFSSSNILSAFSGAGIFPFCPTKVIHRLPETCRNQIINSSSSSESNSEDLLPLNPALLPSSPVDVSTFHTAKNQLSQYMSNNSTFNTPVKIFIDRLVKSSERLWAHNILE